MNKVVHGGVLGLLLLLGAGCLFDKENLDVPVSLEAVVLPFSHTLSSSHSLPSSSGSQVRPVLLKECQCVLSGYGMVDLTAILRCEHGCSCIREHYVSLLASFCSLDRRGNGNYIRIWPLLFYYLNINEKQIIA